MYNFKVTQSGFHCFVNDKENADKCVAYLRRQVDLIDSVGKEQHRAAKSELDKYGLDPVEYCKCPHVYIIYWSLQPIHWHPKFEEDLDSLKNQIYNLFSAYRITGRVRLDHDDCFSIGSYSETTGMFRLSDVTWVQNLTADQLDELRNFAYDKGYVTDKDI